ncbi:MAG: hypothetical protein RL139_1546 [Gemmatimonadota bacterium]|jgi:hypothetical protein
MTSADFEKTAALGAKGVAAGAMLAWLGFVFLTRPVPTGGIDRTLHLVVAAASFVPFTMVAASHYWFGWQLARGKDVIRG